MEFYQILRKLRAEAGISGEELGKQIGLDKSSISRLEKGETTPKSSTLIALSNYFNVSTDYLMGRTDQKRPEKQVTEDDFLVAFSGLSENLTDDDKQAILKMAQAFASSNEAKKK